MSAAREVNARSAWRRANAEEAEAQRDCARCGHKEAEP